MNAELDQPGDSLVSDLHNDLAVVIDDRLGRRFLLHGRPRLRQSMTAHPVRSRSTAISISEATSLPVLGSSPPPEGGEGGATLGFEFPDERVTGALGSVEVVTTDPAVVTVTGSSDVVVVVVAFTVVLVTTTGGFVVVEDSGKVVVEGFTPTVVVVVDVVTSVSGSGCTDVVVDGAAVELVVVASQSGLLWPLPSLPSPGWFWSQRLS